MTRNRTTSASTFVICITLLLLPNFAIDSTGDERNTIPDVGPDTIEPLSYQDSDYAWSVIPPDVTPPLGFEQLGFNDSIFNFGNAPFGSRGRCPLQSTVQTTWPANSQLLVRRFVSIPAGATNVRILAIADNDILGVFFNGVPLTSAVSHEACPVLDEFRFNVPQSLLRQDENLVAFRILDRGVASYFDARILAERPRSRKLKQGIIDANINGVHFTATMSGNWDLFPQGGMIGRVIVDFSNLPQGFSPMASSGLSWLSWSNTCSPAPTEPPKPPAPPDPPTPGKKKPKLSDCDSLHGWNYVLERQNIFPDGNTIDMKFIVTRVSSDEVTMSGQWSGKYALGTDIVYVEQPLIEELVSDGPGRIKGFYRYELVRSDGSRFSVDTFSTYTFTPVEGSDGLLKFPQRRVTTNAWFLESNPLRLTVTGQSVMLPSTELITH